jgi:hypothetical protein
MTLPTFLGIGAPRAGTTWLNTLLASHPDVYTPTLRDEINFFDKYYELGPDWYQALFPSSVQAGKYQAIGEVTPRYLECDECPKRIFAMLPESKLIVLLRHPIDRAYSQYGFFVQRRNYRGSFEDFIADYPRALERGLYSRYLKQYLHYFDRSRILALIFEETVSDINTTKKTLAKFLNIDEDRFPPSSGKRKVNPSSIPKFQLLSGFVAMTGRQFRRWHLEPIVDFVMRTGILKLLTKGQPLPPLNVELKKNLSKSYRNEFEELEQCMQINLRSWRIPEELGDQPQLHTSVRESAS